MTTNAFSPADEHYMRRALTLAQRGQFTTDPNPQVGCVLVRDGRIVGEGWTQPAGDNHAEVEALNRAGENAAGATAYVTLEPCSHHGRTGPCVAALRDACVAEVVVALEDANPEVAGRGVRALMDAGIVVRVGLLAEKAERMNAGFLSRMRGGHPRVRVKSAMSLDGRTALANGQSFWITGELARADVHRYRALSSAIVTGIGTVLADDPQLTARMDVPQVPAVAVVMDSQLRCPPTARVVAHPGGCIVVGQQRDEPAVHQRGAALIAAGAQVVLQPEVTPLSVLTLLAAKDINEVLVEAGATLTGAWLATDLVDEWIIYQAPCVLGSPARPLLVTPEWTAMSQRKNWRRRRCKALGDDLKMILEPAPVVTSEENN
ncbi:MAG: bifunctional diaminohydroxyphosphoribosylaminopyrimidine deaminase/5-amino-6-(5-phosphoribosylamino)uracil reductase RibD [Gammaproteobacteria bacterium]